MLAIFNNLSSDSLKKLLKRPAASLEELEPRIKPIFEDVSSQGDAALIRYTALFDKVNLSNLIVTETEWAEADALVDATLQQAIRTAADNITRFHAASPSVNYEYETMPGVLCSKKRKPIPKVGLYVPGGTAPLFSSVLMLGIPARLAGCKEILLCTPPQKDGKVHPAILFAAKVAGISKVVKVGGAQAIAAMIFGTESVPKVHKIAGPGNAYVTVAKQMAGKYGVAIDMPAGPSEVMVVCGPSAVASFAAADLLSQAEHGADSQVILLCRDEQFAEQVNQELTKQLALLPRADLATKALESSKIIIVPTDRQTVQVIDEYAPEHLILMGTNAEDLAEKVNNAGSIFIGNYTPESAGDYASGTNHTLPTAGFAAAYSGVSVDTFCKNITYQRISEDGLKALGPTIISMAEAEQLQAHANAVKIRLSSLGE